MNPNNQPNVAGGPLTNESTPVASNPQSQQTTQNKPKAKSTCQTMIERNLFNQSEVQGVNSRTGETIHTQNNSVITDYFQARYETRHLDGKENNITDLKNQLMIDVQKIGPQHKID